MEFLQQIRRLLEGLDTPTLRRRLNPVRWVLLDGDRIAVAGSILAFIYTALLSVGLVWTAQVQDILTETTTIENILASFMSGSILLVSIVVSINSIVLSQDIASVQDQANRTRGASEFRDNIGAITETGESPSDPRAFLQLMATVITDRAQTLSEDMKRTNDGLADEMEAYTESILDSIGHMADFDDTNRGDFNALWRVLDVDYGAFLERSRALRSDHREVVTESHNEQLDSLVEAIQLFAIGRENFKTLYYYKEVSVLSRTLLIVSLPAILITATAILIINAGIFPEFSLFGLPPIQVFVATAFTIALVPYAVLTSYMLRLSTVGIRTASAGPFSLND